MLAKNGMNDHTPFLKVGLEMATWIEVKESRKMVKRTCHVLEELGMKAFRDALKNCRLD